MSNKYRNHQPALIAEDFKRLGVRDGESNVAVIRRATARQTRRLAKRQQNDPQAAIEQERLLVVTTAYRLMDPRNRRTSSRNTSVGRILPSVLAAASCDRYPPLLAAVTTVAGNQTDSKPTDPADNPSLPEADEKTSCCRQSRRCFGGVLLSLLVLLTLGGWYGLCKPESLPSVEQRPAPVASLPTVFCDDRLRCQR